MKIPYQELKDQFKRVLMNLSFSEGKADHCAGIFADNTCDGVYSHGINRFPVFVKYVKEGLIHIHEEPVLAGHSGLVETWDGRFGPGMYNARRMMDRAISLAKANGIGCVVIKNTNHWMRGGTYAWQAAGQGCISICCSNTIANMPPWGGKTPRLGNNPLVIGVPREKGHVVLDMALSQFSYGKLQEYSIKKENLPVPGGYDDKGELTTDPSAIVESQRPLPVGFWKGAGLSLMLDILVCAIGGGQSTARITESGQETGLSQFFLCFYQEHYNAELIEEIIAYSRSGMPVNDDQRIQYPGERTLATREKNMAEGIPVHPASWNALLAL